MISIEKLTKTYGSKSIITNWHFTFENGKIYGLIGRNGIGKTTILKCMSGLCEADALKLSTDAGGCVRPGLSDAEYLLCFGRTRVLQRSYIEGTSLADL